MDWTIKPYDKANHPPVPKLAHPAKLTAQKGGTVNLSAEGSTDPDGDELTYEWFYYGETGSFTFSSARTGQPLTIKLVAEGPAATIGISGSTAGDGQWSDRIAELSTMMESLKGSVETSQEEGGICLRLTIPTM